MPPKQYKAVDHRLMRQLNTSLILSSLRLAPGQTRADLAAYTGLTRGTVTGLVNDLLARGLVHEVDLLPSKGGRPGISLALNPDGGAAIGLEIKDSFVSILLTDFVAQPIWQETIVLEETAVEAVLAVITTLVEQALTEAARRELTTLGIGVGASGLVNAAQGVVTVSPHLGWDNVPLRSILAEKFQLTVKVVNDANVSAMAERYFGAATGCDNFIYLEGSQYGIGGGIFVNGKLFQGVGGYAGEVGHMVVKTDGRLCTCGRRGCWETEVGPKAIVRRARQWVEQGADTLLTELVGGQADQVSLALIKQAADSNDPLTLELLAEVGRLIGIGLANLTNLFNPQLAIVGGTLRQLQPHLQASMTETMHQEAFAGPAEQIEIKASTLEAACTLGAVALVLDEILHEPSWQAKL